MMNVLPPPPQKKSYKRRSKEEAVEHLRFPGVGKICRGEFARTCFSECGDERKGVPPRSMSAAKKSQILPMTLLYDQPL